MEPGAVKLGELPPPSIARVKGANCKRAGTNHKKPVPSMESEHDANQEDWAGEMLTAQNLAPQKAYLDSQ